LLLVTWVGLTDAFLKVWDVDTGLCLHVLRGHLNQIYCVSYDGVRIASGGLDTHVRIWDPKTGSVAPPFLNPLAHAYSILP
jgi:F-box and WD-40 domain protein CDC4